jgi:hypothetical protein
MVRRDNFVPPGICFFPSCLMSRSILAPPNCQIPPRFALLLIVRCRRGVMPGGSVLAGTQYEDWARASLADCAILLAQGASVMGAEPKVIRERWVGGGP